MYAIHTQRSMLYGGCFEGITGYNWTMGTRDKR